jgi:hypothetical protein
VGYGENRTEIKTKKKKKKYAQAGVKRRLTSDKLKGHYKETG